MFLLPRGNASAEEAFERTSAYFGVYQEWILDIILPDIIPRTKAPPYFYKNLIDPFVQQAIFDETTGP